jgi:hypothetical protein
MIFHDVLKKGAAVLSTRQNFLNQKALDAVFDKNINSYEQEGLEFVLWREFCKVFFVYFQNLTDNWILSRDEFEVFWVHFIGIHPVKDS